MSAAENKQLRQESHRLRRRIICILYSQAGKKTPFIPPENGEWRMQYGECGYSEFICRNFILSFVILRVLCGRVFGGEKRM
jgi:hypothetical protein